MRKCLAVAITAGALLAATAAFGGCEEPTFHKCNREGSVRATVIKTHSWPFPDITAAYVDNHAWWRSVGWNTRCYGEWVEGMRGSIYCYYNPTQDSTVGTACQKSTYGRSDWWNHVNGNGRFSRSGDHTYWLWTTVYASDDVLFSGSCTVHGDGIGGGTRFSCAPHRIK